LQHMGINHGGADILVPQQFLHGANIITSFEQMSRKAMAARIVTLLIHRQYFRSVTPIIPSLDRRLSWSEEYVIRPRTALSLNSPMA
jgi:hypothetical protein